MQTNTTDQFQVKHIESVRRCRGGGGEGDRRRHRRKICERDRIGQRQEDFEKPTRSFEADSGFMLFLSLKHGGFLTLMGFPAKVRQCTIGNPLVAATTLQHDVGAGLNVPVRLVICEARTGARALVMIDRRRSWIDSATPNSPWPPESWTPSLRRSRSA
jgi:hypothetical protein